MDSFISAFILKLDINRLCINNDPGPLELQIPGLLIIANYYRPRSEGDNVLGSVRPSVRPFVCLFVRALLFEPFDQKGWNLTHYQSSGVCLCVCNQWAYAGNCADAVDRLLIQPGQCRQNQTGCISDRIQM